MKNKIILLGFVAISLCSTAYAQITVAISSSAGTTVCNNQTITFTAAITGCTGSYTIIWIKDGFNQDTCTNPCTTWTTTLSTGTPTIWCNVNCSPQGTANSNGLSMTVNPCSGIEELVNGDLSSVYPNPSTENISIEFSGSGNSSYTLEVYKQNGEHVKVIYQMQSNAVLFSAKQFAEGIYYYRLRDEKGKSYSAGKFVITK